MDLVNGSRGVPTRAPPALRRGHLTGRFRDGRPADGAVVGNPAEPAPCPPAEHRLWASTAPGTAAS
ncbi:hypothetical protein GCM10022214_65120 [Actinomadura miaoliensis]|uniref:Uncharacterized protein n=1 Tax=Actinomadura miaoliensis TaxID=430685 RepID=A0ABP7WPM0_9ACTN